MNGTKLRSSGRLQSELLHPVANLVAVDAEKLGRLRLIAFGALEGLHGGEGTRFSEEFQAAVYRETTAMLERIPQYRGMTPWILADFRSPRRLLPGVQDGWNRKGVIGETGARKQAFYVLQDYYRKKAEGSRE